MVTPDRLKLGGTYVDRFRALCDELGPVEVAIHARPWPLGEHRDRLYAQREDIWRRLAELETAVAQEPT